MAEFVKGLLVVWPCTVWGRIAFVVIEHAVVINMDLKQFSANDAVEHTTHHTDPLKDSSHLVICLRW
jgi:hypothetical protein